MDRFSILSKLQTNWPGKYSMDRVSFIERELRDFSNEVMELAVTDVLRSAEFPPTVKALHSACSRANQNLIRNKPKRKYRPGDVVDDERTLTPHEAAIELERIVKEYPDAMSAPGSFGTRDLQTMVTRIYIGALKRCIALDPSVKVSISDMKQSEMF